LVAAHVMYWFEREFLVYPFRPFNVKVLEQYQDKLLLTNGWDSNREALQFRATLVLGEELGLKVNLFAGMHVGFASHPDLRETCCKHSEERTTFMQL